jgi:DNA-binding transcriptional regulator/RsmH inhibitor MraZ
VQNFDQGGAQVAVIEEPHGVAQASVDDKGRLKLPVEFIAYLEAFGGGKKLFITTLDGRLGRIYPMPIWQSNLNELRNAEDQEMALRIQFDAKLNGDAVEIDDNGRVLLPASFRKTLGIAGRESVSLEGFNCRVNLMTGQELEARKREMAAKKAGDLAALGTIKNFK